MADAEKAAKLAAAKKKVAELKKKQQKSKAGASKKEETKKDDKAEKKADEKEEAPANPPTPEPEASTATPPAPVPDEELTAPAPEEEENDDVAPLSPTKEAAPSLAQQSRARSASFRKPSISGSTTSGMFSPEGETALDIYRKHVARIEELEKENKRLVREAGDAEKRWQKAESQLADLRDDDTSGKTDTETEKLRNDIAALKRQNDQLQAQLAAKAGGGGARHGPSPSISVYSPPAVAELEAQLTSKSATIETMELEMSRLRAQVERLSLSASSPSEQISALEEKLARAEKAAALAQRELSDLKKNLDRTAEKAVKAGSGLASAETKIRSLEKEVEEVKTERDELVKKVDGLEKKVSTLTTLHREQDGRMQAVRKEKDARDKEVTELKTKLEKLEAENVKLRKEHAADGGGDDEGVDELENEGRLRLEKRIRDLEAENTDLRRGIWHEKRKELQVGPDDAGGKFTDVDLGNGEPHHSRRKSTAGGGFGELITSGLNALAGVSGGTHHGEDEGFLDDEEDMEFDEEAFRKAHEEEAQRRLERIREIKRGLKNWEGWRLDLVENRRGGGEGIGDIFEV